MLQKNKLLYYLSTLIASIYYRSTPHMSFTFSKYEQAFQQYKIIKIYFKKKNGVKKENRQIIIKQSLIFCGIAFVCNNSFQSLIS